MASSTNYLVNVPKLKGRENFSEWCFAAENFLVLEGMVGCIKPEPGHPPVAADDARTKAKLILTIDPALYVHIRSVTTSKELWDKLKMLFDDSGFTRKINLLRNLISIRLENCTSMTSYVTQIVEAGQKLQGTGFGINDEWIGSIMLAGLTEKYMPMIMAIENSGVVITTDAIKGKLMDMDPEVSDVNNAFACFRKNQHSNSNYRMNGKNTQSMVKKDDGKSQMSSAKGNPNVKCYNCKQQGHYRNQCNFKDKSSNNSEKKSSKTSNAFSAVFFNRIFDKSDWYVDSGASSHLTSNRDWMTDVNYSGFAKEIIVANQNKIPVMCCGNIKITTSTEDSDYDITVENVLCVPKLSTNLLSVSQLIRQGNKVHFTSKGCEILNMQDILVATASLVNGVYKLNTPSCMVAAVAESVEVWHRRLGHANSYNMNKMQDAVEGVIFTEKANIVKSNCIVCCEGKQSRLPFAHEGNRSTKLLEVVHSDICGPMENISLGGSRYFLIFVDDHSRMTYVYFLKNKTEALKYFQEYKARVENSTSNKIKILRSDNGREFCNRDFGDYLKKMGIIHQKTNPYSPEQNGLCERMNRTLIEKARCLLFDAGLDKEFWAEAINTAVYLQNRIVKSGLNHCTPFELWTGSKPNLSHLRIFGSTVMKHIPKEKRHKWDKKSEQTILVGYPEDIKGYRLYNPSTRAIVTSRDVIFIKEKLPHQESMIDVQEIDDKPAENRPHPSSVGELSDQSMEDSFNSIDSTNSMDETYVPDEQVSEEELQSYTRETILPQRQRRKPDRYGLMCTEECNKYLSDELTYEEALRGPEKEQWELAVQEELNSFKDNNAWDVVDIPASGNIVKCKWVLKKKCDGENNIRYRARLVAKGCSQKYGIDYSETFSPVVRHTTLRLLFALSVQLNLNVTHLDVKTAFLNSDLSETIYMQKPLGYVCPNNKVLKLNKAIYGLKQASRAWHMKVDSCMLASGYTKSKIEPCLYIKCIGGSKTIVTLYVDDFFVFSNDKTETDYLKSVLSKYFVLKDLGIVKECLGMSVVFDKQNSTVTLSQEKYIDKLLSKFNMVDSKTVNTPMEVNLKCKKENNCSNENPYQQLIGSLMYLVVLTRPDIAYAVSYLSQFNNCNTEQQWAYGKRVLRYLKGTKQLGLKYCKIKNVNIEGYVDADWCNDVNDRKSYSGFCYTLSGSVISWSCTKQKCITLSSTEAEYVSISEACKEAVYLRNLQHEITGRMYNITLYNDSMSAQKLLMNPVFHNKTKHIDVRYHYCREIINENIVSVKYLCTSDMPADLFTKSLSAIKHYRHLNTLGIVEV